MKTKSVLIVISLIAIATAGIYYYNNQGSTEPDLTEKFFHYQQLDKIYPYSSEKYEIKQYSGFHLAYNEEHEQAAWTIYLLTGKHLSNPVCDRTDNFMPDTNITTGSAELSDYKRSGFDRGHLVPAGDMKWSETAMNESFYLSNMSPQRAKFNRGIWKKLEEKVRDIAEMEDSIIVITGPVLKNINKHIGDNQVSVPEKYFKIIFDISQPDQGMIALLMNNEKSKESLESFCISVDELEAETGIDFFRSMDDGMEDIFEKSCPEYLVNYLR